MTKHITGMTRALAFATSCWLLVGLAAAQTTTRISVGSAGEESDARSSGVATSSDGRYTVFESRATTLIPGLVPSRNSIYRHDRVTGVTALASANAAGEEANNHSNTPSISANGRFVAFASDADNLVVGDSNGVGDAFVRDMDTGIVERVSVDSSGVEGNSDSFWPRISADGLSVAFVSVASNLVGGDSNSRPDVFLHDRATSTTQLISISSAGVQANGDNNRPVVSADGAFVAWASFANNLVASDTNNTWDIFVRDVAGGVTERVSVHTNGAEANLFSQAPSISGDGRFVAFHSQATTLVDNDTNNQLDAFVRDRTLSETIRVSVNSLGDESNGESLRPSISSSGDLVVFASDANNLTLDEFGPWFDVYVHDLQTGETAIVSTSTSAGAPDQNSGQNEWGLALSGDGSIAAYESAAGNLVLGDTNGVEDVFSTDIVFGCNRPRITGVSPNQRVCDGDAVTLSVTAVGDAPLSYQWRKDGVDIPGAVTDALVIDPASSADTGFYDVAVTNPCGVSNSDPIDVVVGLRITQQPLDRDGCLNADIRFSVRAQGAQPLTYQWRKDGVAISGRTGRDLDLFDVTLADAGAYDAEVTNVCGTFVSAAGTLTIVEPIVITRQPGDRERCIGTSVTFSVGFDGGPATEIQWRHNDVAIPGANEISYTDPNVTLVDEGAYTVSLSNICGPATSTGANLTVLRPPVITDDPNSVEICQGQSATFAVQADNLDPNSVQWRHDGVDISGAQALSYTIDSATPADAGNYDAVVTNSCGAVSSSAAVLTVLGEVTPTITTEPENTTACLGGAVTLSVVADGTNLQYQWRRWNGAGFDDVPGANSPGYTIDPVSAGDDTSYNVVVSNLCDAVISRTVSLLIDSGAIQFLRQPADQAGCETGTASFEVIVQATPPIQFEWRQDGVPLPDSNGRILTLVNLTLADAGFYDVVASTTCGSATSAAAELTVAALSPPLITVQPQSQPVCELALLTLSVRATGAAPISYQWRQFGMDIPGAMGQDYVVASASAADAGEYDVVVSNPCATATSDPATVTVVPVPAITQQPFDRRVSEGEGVTFIVKAAGEGLNYQWRFGGVDIAGANSDTFTIVEVVTADVGAYDVVVSNACGTATSTTAQLTRILTPHTDLISVSSVRVQGDRASRDPSVSADGRYVTFSSGADTLVPGLADGVSHLFLHDRRDATTISITRNRFGWQTTDDSFVAEISPDERWLVFDSDASNIVPGDLNGARDIFLGDIVLPDFNTRRISVSTAGEPGNGASADPAISQNGMFVAFHSDADNLIAGDVNGVADVFTHARVSGTTTRISEDPNGVGGNGASRAAAISLDGFTIAFESAANNLVSGDTNGFDDILVFDGIADATFLISVSSSGAQGNGHSAQPAISRDGRHVAFQSDASNLAAGDSNGVSDIFVRDRTTRTTALVSLADDGTIGDGDSFHASISGDGRYVAYASLASNLVTGDSNGVADVFVYDRDPDGNGTFDEGNGVTIRVSVESNGQQSDAPSDWPNLASNGSFVVFQSDATNIVLGDNNRRSDIFRHDIGTRSTSRISVDDNEQPALGASLRPFVSGALQFVVFASDGNLAEPLVSDENGKFDIYARNVQLDETRILSRGWVANDSSFRPKISADGSVIVFSSDASNLTPDDNSVFQDVFAYDVATGAIELVSVNSASEQADDSSSEPALSDDGRYIVFVSGATNLDANDSNGGLDVFLRDRLSGTTELVSLGDSGQQPGFQPDSPDVSNDGRYVAFRSVDGGLVPGDTNGRSDIFVRDRLIATTTRVSVDSSGTESDGDSTEPRFSGDGRFVAFSSFAGNLVPADTNAQSDIFVHELATGRTVLASVSMTGSVGNDGSSGPSMSEDGRFVVFESGATDLVPSDTNARVDAFVRDLQLGITHRTSISDAGLQGDRGSANPAISSDGRYIAFDSVARNLVSADFNGRKDVFIHDSRGCLLPAILSHPVDRSVFTGQAFSLSVSASGTPPLGFAWRKDGVVIPGETSATLLFAGADPNDAGAYDAIVSNDCGQVISNTADVTVEDCRPLVEMVSSSTSGVGLGDGGGQPAMSADGRYVAFQTSSDNIVQEDAFGFTDVFVRDRHTGTVVWISRSHDGRFGNNSSGRPSLSADGRFVAFHSSADNLVVGDTNGMLDVFLHDRDPDQDGEFDEPNSVTIRLSENALGVQGNNQSRDPVLSADGRFVAFNSLASNLIPGGTSSEQVYVRDLQANTIEIVSVDNSGVFGNDDSRAPSISGDGRYVVFSSRAGNLVASDTNPFADVFLHDRSTGVTSLVSVDAAGASVSGESSLPRISVDGRFVSFTSAAALVPADTNGMNDVYVRDLQSGSVERASLDTAGAQANGDSTQSAISADGRFVAFYSNASNLIANDTNGFRDLFLRDRVLGTTVPAGAAGLDTLGDADTGTGGSPGLAVSNDGDWIAFQSLAGNFAPDDDNGQPDVFLRNVEEARTVRMSISDFGVSGSGLSQHASVSNDGRFVAFASGAANLVPADTNAAIDVFLHDRFTGETRRINVGPNGAQMPPLNDAGNPAVSGDGRYVAYFATYDALVPGDFNGRRDVLVYDVLTDLNVIVSVDSSGVQSNSDNADTPFPIAISGDGRKVAFTSRATNLVPDDTNGDVDVFVHDRDPDGNGIYDEGNGVTTRANTDSAGNQTNGFGDHPAFSDDGLFVAFRSDAVDLVPNDTNGAIDIFVKDLTTGAVSRASVDSAGVEANAACDFPSLSADAAIVAFSSIATNLDPLDTNSRPDVFVHNRATGQTSVASLNSQGDLGNGPSQRLALSDDARFVAFDSFATNLNPDDNNGVADVFLRDLFEGLTRRASVGTFGEQGARDSDIPAISADGGVIAFQTNAELIPGQINRGTNIHIHQRSGCIEPVILEQSGDSDTPEGDPVRLEVVASANPPPKFQWRKDAVEIFGATDRSLTIDNVVPEDAGAYDVIVSNRIGQTTSFPAILTVSSPCLGDLDGNGQVDLTDLAIVLTNFGTASGALPEDGDLDGDGDVDLADLAQILGLFGTICG